MYLLFAFAAVVAVITVAMYGSHVDATEYSQMIEGMYLDENRVIHLPQAAKACLEDLYLHEQDFDSKLLHLKRCEELDFDSVETKIELASFLADNGRFQDAENIFRTVCPALKKRADVVVQLLERAENKYRQLGDDFNEEMIYDLQDTLREYIIMERTRNGGSPERAAQIFYSAKQTFPFIAWTDTYQLAPGFTPGLEAKPWWDDLSQFPGLLYLLQPYSNIILQELHTFLAIGHGSVFELESDHSLIEKGSWTEYILWEDGDFLKEHCLHFPQTCELVSELVQVTGWPKGAKQYTLDGQVTLMKLSPESHLRPHTGPHNERLTAHLALIIPFGVAIRVANETRGYTELEVSVFDDSFEHEVWHRGTVGERYILYLTIHHPDLDLELEKPAHYKAFFQALDESLSVYDYDEDEYFDYDDYAEYDDQDESSDSDSTSNIYEKDDIDSEESPIHDEL